ncbi:hypothetical protein ABZS94_35175 [Streptomyces sp. NPDC005500]|uniref:hypothetical protein n=1 Tax=Streptomyces sp. NPDC005500 TaxID=3155007 RepID=UPI00339EB7A1
MDFSHKHDVFNLQDVCGGEISPEQQVLARKVTAAHALGRADLRLLLDVMGLLPLTEDDQPTECLQCGRTYVRTGSGRASYYCSQRCWRSAQSKDAAA